MATTQYIGSRYVPILADPVEWSSTKSYEPLTIVTHDGNSYTSRQFVPQGIDITNEDYWALTGNYNAQIEQYRRETAQAVEHTDAAVNQVDEWLTDAQDKYGAKAFAFDNVEAMRRCDTLYAGAICHTNGFHASGDGGECWYLISENGTRNDMDIIQCDGFIANAIFIDDEINVKQFGAIGNGVANDYDAINRCFYIAANQNKNIVFPKVDDGYFTQSPIVFEYGTINNPTSINVTMYSPIKYKSVGKAITFKNISNSKLFLSAIYDENIWLNTLIPNTIGVSLENVNNSDVTIDNIVGFETNLYICGDNYGTCYNRFYLGTLRNSTKAIVLTAVHNGWCNENEFFKGRIFCNSYVPYSPQDLAVELNASSCNNNVFHEICFEGAKLGIHFITCRNCYFENVRSEGATEVFIAEETAVFNYVTAGYGTVRNTNKRQSNMAASSWASKYFSSFYPIFSSDNILDSFIYNNSEYYLQNDYICAPTSADTFGVKNTNGNIVDQQIVINGIAGVLLDTSQSKEFIMLSKATGDGAFRGIVKMYDSNGGVLSEHIKPPLADYSFNTTFNWLQSQQNDYTNVKYIIVPENCVKAFIGFNCVNVKLDSIYVMTKLPNNEGDIYNACVISSKLAKGLNSIPTSDNPIGTFCPKKNATNTGAVGWIKTTTGWREI